MKRNPMITLSVAAVLLTAVTFVCLVVGVRAVASPDHNKPWICHPVNGKGETGYGWTLINPDKASSHIDEKTGKGKHTSSDGRTDVYAVDGKCPGAPTTEPTDQPTDPTSEPTDQPTDSTSTPPVVTEPPYTPDPTRDPSDNTDNPPNIIGQTCNGTSCTTYYTEGDVPPLVPDKHPKHQPKHPKHQPKTPVHETGSLPNTGA